MCSFQKFGFCKFKEGCKKTHFTQICEDMSGCKDIKQCEKRHPKTARNKAKAVSADLLFFFYNKIRFLQHFSFGDILVSVTFKF